MAALVFSKTGVTSLVFARQDSFPRPAQGDENELTGITQSQLVRVAILNPPTTYIPLNFANGMLDEDYVALGVFLQDPLIQFRAFAFTFQDSDSSTQTVRYWDGFYQFTRSTPNLWHGKLTLRRV